MTDGKKAHIGWVLRQNDDGVRGLVQFIDMDDPGNPQTVFEVDPLSARAVAKKLELMADRAEAYAEHWEFLSEMLGQKKTLLLLQKLSEHDDKAIDRQSLMQSIRGLGGLF
jgi:hypothetical protein